MRFPESFPAAMAVVTLSLVAMAVAERAGLKGWGGFLAGLAALFVGGPLAAQAEAWWRSRQPARQAIRPMAGGSDPLPDRGPAGRPGRRR